MSVLGLRAKNLDNMREWSASEEAAVPRTIWDPRTLTYHSRGEDENFTEISCIDSLLETSPSPSIIQTPKDLSYKTFSPSHRHSYQQWVMGGRTDFLREFPDSYILLFLSGLERRVLQEGQNLKECFEESCRLYILCDTQPSSARVECADALFKFTWFLTMRFYLSTNPFVLPSHMAFLIYQRLSGKHKIAIRPKQATSALDLFRNNVYNKIFVQGLHLEIRENIPSYKSYTYAAINPYLSGQRFLGPDSLEPFQSLLNHKKRIESEFQNLCSTNHRQTKPHLHNELQCSLIKAKKRKKLLTKKLKSDASTLLIQPQKPKTQITTNMPRSKKEPQKATPQIRRPVRQKSLTSSISELISEDVLQRLRQKK